MKRTETIQRQLDEIAVIKRAQPKRQVSKSRREMIRRVVSYLKSALNGEGAKASAETAAGGAAFTPLHRRQSVPISRRNSVRPMKRPEGRAPSRLDRRSRKRLPFLVLAFTALLSFANFSRAQEEIDITTIVVPGTQKPIPVALSGFSGEVAEVLQFDLYVQGFKFTGPDEAQFLISGSANGNVQGRVMDQVSKQTKLARSYSGAALRRQAHAFADDIVQAITGKPGIAQTKIAFKNQSGQTSEIYVSDFDGHGAQAVTRDGTIVAAPVWVPGKMAIYYTSYKLGNPDIFYQNLTSGERNAVARYSGLNTSAAASPDGSKVAMILSKGGSPDVYVANADGSNLKRLTTTRADESSPCWSPDGQWICFATRINERRTLAKVPASGGEMQRISTAGVSNPSEPAWSPDGKQIAFTSQMRDFNICVIPAGGGTATVLVAGEDPSWSPNSRTLAFTRRAGNSRVISLLDVPTKQVKDIARLPGNNSQPAWAK